jgi:hypothetical protein
VLKVRYGYTYKCGADLWSSNFSGVDYQLSFGKTPLTP